jgi:hypothetical protein
MIRSATLLTAAAVLATAAEPAWVIPDWTQAAVPGGGPACSLPSSHPDADGLRQRAALVVDNLALEDLKKWRTGYFAQGDPGKYLLGAAMAKLLKDPADAMARQYMNDARAANEHYHFAAVNWARFLPIFKDALTPETFTAWSQKAAGAGYIGSPGTENHRVMTYSAGLVLAGYTGVDRFSNQPKEKAIAQLKSWLKDYVKTLYTHGMGEWDSSTYQTFDMNGLLNVYDFGPDAEAKVWARAGMEFYAAAYALKYTDGVFCAPNQRGHAGGPAVALTDQTGWLWWGSSATIAPEAAANFRHTLHAQTSAWRPNAVLTRIARKQVAGLPLTQSNTKPNYWFGQQIPAVRAAWTETVHLASGFTLGSLGKGLGGQATRLELVVRTPTGPATFTGGSPIGRGDANGAIQRYKYADGNGLYDQTAQVGPTLVCLSRIPEDETLAYACLAHPAEQTPALVDGWWIRQVGSTWVIARGLAGAGEAGTTDAPADAKAKKPAEPKPLVKFPGHRTGFVLMAADTTRFPDQAALLAALGKTGFAGDPAALSIALTDLEGKAIRVAWSDAGVPTVTVDGAGVAIPDADAPVYSGPLVHLAAGVLTVSDGTDRYLVDTTGDLPVWR